MNRLFRPLLAGGLALLLIGLLAVLLFPAANAAPRPAACEPSNLLRVPLDCPTIQEALDMIYDQGQIYVQESTDPASTYNENLLIDKSVILWGGWDDEFVNSDGQSVVNAQRLDRGLTISGTEELMVALRGMSIVSGTADGLGGLTESAAFEIDEGYTGEARLAAVETFRGLAGDDCGGGIYARNAHLYLYDVQVLDNMASTTGRGFGGGVCAVDVPYGDEESVPPPFQPGLRISKESVIAQNIASTAAEGAGGGIFVANAVGQVAVVETHVEDNLASTGGNAYGGGIFAVNIGSYFQGLSTVTDNRASQSADPTHFGRGGGLALVRLTSPTVSSSKFENNTASDGGRGYGGGVYLRGTGDGFELRNSEYLSNRASAATDAGAPGYGGGLFIEDISNRPNNFLRVNTFRGNIASVLGQGAGGGAFVVDAPEIKVFLNMLQLNRAVVAAVDGMSFGGGLAMVNSRHPLVENNTFEGNVAAVNSLPTLPQPRGGGVYLSQTDDLSFADNQVISNTATVDTVGGEGGGLYLADSASDERLVRVIDNLFQANRAGQGGGALLRDASEALVQHNRFVANEASSGQAAGPVMGGGLLLEQANSEQMTATVERNHFLRNTAVSQGAVGGGAAIVSVVDFTLVNNVFAANAGAEAAGLFLAAHPTAQKANEAANNTFSANVGPAIGVQGWDGPAFTFHNSIVDNSPVGVQAPAGAHVTLNYTLWHNTPTRGAGGGVFDDQNSVVGDPVYVDPASDDYHVRKTSAARDAGDPAGIPPAPETDLAAAARPFGERVDIGAYEWRDAVHWPNDYLLLQDAIDVALPAPSHCAPAISRKLCKTGLRWSRATHSASFGGFMQGSRVVSVQPDCRTPTLESPVLPLECQGLNGVPLFRQVFW